MPLKQFFSLITVTLNERENIAGLVKSLTMQTDHEFEWLLIDGMSTDGTVEYLLGLNLPFLKLVSESDRGLYDAVNKGIKLCSGTHYMVIGADDRLDPSAVQIVKSAIKANMDADLIAFPVRKGSDVVVPRSNLPTWLAGQKTLVAEHAVGTVFRKSIHSLLGFYSNAFLVAADNDFVLRCYDSGSKIHYHDSVLGEFALGGVSSREILITLLENFRVQVKRGCFWIQLVLLIGRLMKYRPKS